MQMLTSFQQVTLQPARSGNSVVSGRARRIYEKVDVKKDVFVCI